MPAMRMYHTPQFVACMKKAQTYIIFWVHMFQYRYPTPGGMLLPQVMTICTSNQYVYRSEIILIRAAGDQCKR